MSGRNRLIGRALIEEGDRFEAVVARPAMPEIAGAAFAALDPLRHRDRLAALCTGILPGQIRETGLTHGALPSCYCLLLLLDQFFKGALSPERQEIVRTVVASGHV